MTRRRGMTRRRSRRVRARDRKASNSRLARAGRIRWLRRNKPHRDDD